MPKWHSRALAKLASCRTYAAGRVYYQCEQCQGWQMVPAACGHRMCAQCGHHKARLWEEAQRERLLPVPYLMVTFTVPSQLRQLFKTNQLVCYNALFTESAGTLQDIAADPRHLGGQIGMTSVLHTWRRDLGYHPHIHAIVPAGALGKDGWIPAKTPKKPKKPKKSGPANTAPEDVSNIYFLPAPVLAARMRNRMRDRLRAELPELFKSLPRGTWKRPWNVNIQAVGKGETAFGYLARYVQSTAIGNSRIVACDAKTVTYKWTDRATGQLKKETVAGSEFLRRFLQHALPKGLMRVRHYGFLSAAAKVSYARVRQALGMPAMPIVEAGTTEAGTTEAGTTHGSGVRSLTAAPPPRQSRTSAINAYGSSISRFRH